MTQFTRDRITDGYDKVPNGLWTLAVTAGARVLLGWLHSHTDEFLAALTLNRCRRMLSSSQIAKYLDELEDAGFVTITRPEGKGLPCSFHLHGEPWLDLCQRGVGRDRLTHQAEIGSGVGRDRRAEIGSRRETHKEEDHLDPWADPVDNVDSVDDMPDGSLKARIKSTLERGSGHETD